ncbi:MAG: tRNA 2-thiouridine(34) synthase MnmA [Candidatus Omnitrophota bacterium]|nr:tRNA 2-thiouridine(34) synthase MnmA [Candidatus Omnitrophota bacterium]
MNKKVLIAISGGVDSSLAAHCLLKNGYDVIGLFMQFFSFGQRRDLEKAAAVAARLKIPLSALDLRDDFQDQVIKYSNREYAFGRTPNPCIVCNQKVKFKHLLKKAEELSADYISTGHYARVEYDADKKGFFLKQGVDNSKDQSYMLSGLNRQWLSRIIFPLGGYTKNKVKALAKKLNLEGCNSPESQDICFSDRGKDLCPGPIIDKQNNILGSHNGISHFTIGQRKGLGIAGREPLYVTRIDGKRNAVLVGNRKEIEQDELSAGGLNWLTPERPCFPFRAQVKIRYRHPKSWATVFRLAKDRVNVKFDLAQSAVTPGQTAVFYDQEIVLAGAWIE